MHRSDESVNRRERENYNFFEIILKHKKDKKISSRRIDYQHVKDSKQRTTFSLQNF